MKRIVFSLFLLAACSHGQVSEEAVNGPNETVVIYFSRSGNTEVMARSLAGSLGARLLQLKTWGFERTLSGWFKSQFTGIFNVTSDTDPGSGNFNASSTVFLGFPIWYWKAAPPVRSFVERSQFNGARVIIFATMESAYSEESIEGLKTLITARGGRVTTFLPLKLKSLPSRTPEAIEAETNRLLKDAGVTLWKN